VSSARHTAGSARRVTFGERVPEACRPKQVLVVADSCSDAVPGSSDMIETRGQGPEFEPIGLGMCENDCPEYPAALVATPFYGGLAVTVLGIALILRNAWRRLRRHKTGGDERSPG